MLFNTLDILQVNHILNYFQAFFCCNFTIFTIKTVKFILIMYLLVFIQHNMFGLKIKERWWWWWRWFGPFSSDDDDRRNEQLLLMFAVIHSPLARHSPTWRHASASFKTENFKWISYITRSPHATMNRSITLSAGAKPASQASTRTHTHTHALSPVFSHTHAWDTHARMHTSASTAWKSPYYHCNMRNHGAFQMFDMNNPSTLNKLSFLLAGAINQPHSGCRESS